MKAATAGTQEGPATRAFNETGERVLIATGILGFALAFTQILVRRVDAPLWAWALWSVALALWVSAMFVTNRNLRGVIQSLVLLGFASVPVLLPTLSTSAWLTPDVLLIIGAVGGAIALPIRWSLWVVAAALAIAVRGSIDPSPQMVVAVMAKGTPLAPSIFITFMGLGFVVARFHAARVIQAADNVGADVDRVRRLSVAAARATEARTAVDRRIHETVLNTLSAIAHGGANTDLLRRECRRDLEQMQLGFMPQTEAGLAAIIRSAIEVAGDGEAFVSVDVASDAQLGSGPAGAMRDALVECLRNVNRHARAKSVHIIAWADATHAFVVVSDDGSGMDVNIQERFGVRNSIRSSLRALGGNAILESSPGAGTTVSLSAPLEIRPLKLMGNNAEVRQKDRFLARAGLLGAVVAGCLIAGITRSGVENSGLLLFSMILFAAVYFLLAWVRSRRSRTMICWLVIGLSAPLLGITAVNVRGCESAPVIGAVLATTFGSLFLVFIDAGESRLVRVGIIGSLILAAFTVILQLPSECRSGSNLVLLVMVLLGLCLLWISSTTIPNLQRQEEIRQAALEDIQETEVQLVEFRASRLAWEKITATTKEVLATIADGTVDPADSFVRERARLEEKQLRASMGVEDIGGLGGALRQVAHTASQQGRSVDVVIIGAPMTGADVRPNAVSPAIVAVLERVFLEAPSGTVSARVLFWEGDEEVVVAAEKDSVEALVQQLAGSSVATHLIDEQSRTQVILTWRVTT